MEKKVLSLAHIEAGARILPQMDQPGVPELIVATYNATAKQIKLARTDPSVMTELLDAAAELSAPEAQEVISDFFAQWSLYQRNILSSTARDMMQVKTAADQLPMVKREGEIIIQE